MREGRMGKKATETTPFLTFLNKTGSTVPVSWFHGQTGGFSVKLFFLFFFLMISGYYKESGRISVRFLIEPANPVSKTIASTQHLN